MDTAETQLDLLGDIVCVEEAKFGGGAWRVELYLDPLLGPYFGDGVQLPQLALPRVLVGPAMHDQISTTTRETNQKERFFFFASRQRIV
jgi:hypothetical protein